MSTLLVRRGLSPCAGSYPRPAGVTRGRPIGREDKRALPNGRPSGGSGARSPPSGRKTGEAGILRSPGNKSPGGRWVVWLRVGYRAGPRRRALFRAADPARKKALEAFQAVVLPLGRA